MVDVGKKHQIVKNITAYLICSNCLVVIEPNEDT